MRTLLSCAFSVPFALVHPPLAPSTIFGTRYAAAPDIWLKQPYTRAVDSWGLGVVLYMLLFGQVRESLGYIAEPVSRSWILHVLSLRSPFLKWTALRNNL